MPAEVRREMGVALRAAQGSRRHPHAKPYTTGKHKGWSVIEIVEDHVTDTYRLVYTAHFPDVVFVLCAFKKKSPRGLTTPRPNQALIELRYQLAENRVVVTRR